MSKPVGSLTEFSENNSADNNPPINRPVTRAFARENNINSDDDKNLIDLSNLNMTQPTLSLETLIKLIPDFEGKKGGDIYRFLNACDFAMANVDPSLKTTLVQAIRTKLSGKAFAVTQNRVITDWIGLKTLLENTFRAQRTPGYLQLELNSTRQHPNEPVQEYATRVENLLCELCNVSVSGKSTEAAIAIREYIKDTTLTTFVEGLEPNLKQTIKARHHASLEEAINDSLEEEILLRSNRDAQRLLKDKQEKNTVSKYCSICRKTNHYTTQCKFAKTNSFPRDTGQKNYTQQTTPSASVHKVSCSFCKIKGHSIDECFKKKRADKRQAGNQPTTSGNGPRPGTSGERSVKDIRMLAQM